MRIHPGPGGSGDDEARVDFDAYRMTWLPVACVVAPVVCWHVYQSLERGTVVEAARLRRYMYNHKRA